MYNYQKLQINNIFKMCTYIKEINNITIKILYFKLKL